MINMSPRERVLAALTHQRPDRVPWVENAIHVPMQLSLMGGAGFTPGDLCRRLGMDGFGATFPIHGRDGTGKLYSAASGGLDAYYYPDKVNFDFFNAYITETNADATPGRSFLARRLLDSRESLSLFDEFQPDPDHPARYERVSGWIRDYKEDFAVFARLDLGTAATVQSMGLDRFSYSLADDPGLIRLIHQRFSDWAAKTIAHLNTMDFDFFWVMDDLAWNQAPFFSPRVFREFIFPYMREVAQVIRKPWVFHSDGNILPLLDDLVRLGMNAIHPIQPGAMDISQVKAKYGSRLCLVGNIDVGYTLTQGSPSEVDQEVKERIETVGRDGGYIISSSISITDYCRPENVLAMADAVRKYGAYKVA